MRINKTRFAIMGMLMLHPMSGYDIKKSMQRSTNYFWTESDGQLYPILKQLEKEKLVNFKKEKTGKRERKIYHLTSAGRKAFIKWFEMPTEMPVGRSELFLKLFFGQYAPKGENIKHVKKQLEKLYQTETICKKGIEHLKEEHKNDPNQPYWLITINAGLTSTQAGIQWCKETLKILEKLDKPEKKS